MINVCVLSMLGVSLQRVRVSGRGVHFKYILVLFVNHTAIKLKKKYISCIFVTHRVNTV